MEGGQLASAKCVTRSRCATWGIVMSLDGCADVGYWCVLIATRLARMLVWSTERLFFV